MHSNIKDPVTIWTFSPCLLHVHSIPEGKLKLEAVAWDLSSSSVTRPSCLMVPPSQSFVPTKLKNQFPLRRSPSQDLHHCCAWIYPYSTYDETHYGHSQSWCPYVLHHLDPMESTCCGPAKHQLSTSLGCDPDLSPPSANIKIFVDS